MVLASLVLLVLALVVLVVSPRADAFVGEDLVIQPTSPPTVTGPAQTIISNPTFIQNAGEEGAEAASKLATVGSKIPAVFRVLPYVGGAVAAIEVCKSVLGGCFIFAGEEGFDPPRSVGWAGPTIKNTTISAWPEPRPVAPPFVYYATESWRDEREEHQCDGSGLNPFPPEATGAILHAGTYGFVCSGGPNSGQTMFSQHKAAIRDAFKNRTITHSPADNPSIPNHTGDNTFCGPSNCLLNNPEGNTVGVSQRMAASLLGQGDYGKTLTEDQRNDLGQHIASEIDSSISDPYEPVVVPDCAGLVWQECQAELVELELVPQRSTLSWQEAHINKPGAAVVSTQPQAGEELKRGTAVVVTTNPNENEMPLLMPALPSDPNEHYQTYADLLTQKGYPAPVVRELTEATADPKRGPDAVASVSPEPGTRSNPAQPPQPTIRVNPPTMPIVGGGGSCLSPSIRPFDLGPLAQNYGDQFPFAVFSWFSDWFGDIANGANAPVFDLTLGPMEGAPVLHLDMGDAEGALEIVRPVLIVASALGFTWMLASLAMGWGRGGDD